MGQQIPCRVEEGQMSIDVDYSLGRSPRTVSPKTAEKRHRVMVALNDEQMAAVEGWRMAHGISDQADALGELVRLALLGEIAKIYRLVSDNRSSGKQR
jgi:hypothetical protein